MTKLCLEPVPYRVLLKQLSFWTACSTLAQVLRLKMTLLLSHSDGPAVIREFLGNFSRLFSKKVFDGYFDTHAEGFFVTRACPGFSRDGR
jgi:hypothetical protein